jgi:hypothetical protein
MFQKLSPIDRGHVIKKRNMCPFFMKHTAVAECYGKCTMSTPACPIPECNKNMSRNCTTF